MQLRELRQDIRRIALKSRVTDDSRLTSRHIDYKIRQYRADIIYRKYYRVRKIQPSWIQRFTSLPATRVSSADDPNVSGCNCKFGKIIVPEVIDLPNDTGVYRLSSSCETKLYHWCTIDRFFEFTKDGFFLQHNRWFFRIGDALYMYPEIDQVQAHLILQDPMKGYRILTQKIESGDIELNQEYQIEKGRITYDGTVYKKGDTFTGTITKTYTGKGIVKFKDFKRKITDKDPYPMDFHLATEVAMNILTRDLRIEKEQIADLINDAQDELSILQPNT